MKITVVGAGAVGASCAEYIAIKNFASEVVLVDIKEGKEISYNLQKYQRSNQDTCINQRPSVWLGEEVVTGQVIADGAATEGGELALGQNILVAYVPWEGYNYEDAFLISERLVYNDVYTSVHIEKYEIELEVLNQNVGAGTEYPNSKLLSKALRKAIIYVLSGLQNTNYPIPYSEIRTIGDQYLKLVYGKEYNERMKMKPKMFLGPSSSTLQMANITPINEDTVIPNIRNDYTVTEKADGMRKLLYINKNGKIYLIDTNMNVQYTGAMTKNVDLFETILDGEHILHNKKGDFINLYAAFDVYIVNKKDVRANSFIPPPNDDNKTIVLTNYRLPVLINTIKNLGAVSSVLDKSSPIRIEHKNFKSESKDVSIFQCCNTIIDQQKQGLYEYEVDGLIFTPAYFGVASDKAGEAGPLNKPSWEYSFKWKPPEFNTIDFLLNCLYLVFVFDDLVHVCRFQFSYFLFQGLLFLL